MMYSENNQTIIKELSSSYINQQRTKYMKNQEKYLYIYIYNITDTLKEIWRL